MFSHTQSPMECAVSERCGSVRGQARAAAVVFTAFYANVVVLGKLYSISLLVDVLLSPPCSESNHTNATAHDDGGKGNASARLISCGGFGEGRGSTAWTGSAIISVYFLSCAIAGGLADKIGFRSTAIIGALITATATLASSFVQSLPIFILLFSVVGGSGVGLVDVSGIGSVLVHHPKHFAVMMGLVASGSGIGVITFGLTYDTLLHAVGWRWTVRLFSLLVFILALLALTYPNREADEKERSESESPTRLSSSSSSENDDAISYIAAIKSGTTLPGSFAGQPDVYYLNWNKFDNNAAKAERKGFVDWKLLRNPYVLAVGFGRSLAYFGYSIAVVHMVSLARDLKVTDFESSLVVITYGVGELCGRFGVGWLAAWKETNRYYIQQVAVFFIGVSTILASTISSLGPLLAYTCTIGILTGSTVTLSAVVLKDLLEKEEVPRAFGYTTSFRAPFTLIAPPIAGWIYDRFQSYESAFYLGGSVAILGSLLYLIIPYCQRRERRRFSCGLQEKSNRDDITGA